MDGDGVLGRPTGIGEGESGLEIRLLGPLEIRRGGSVVALPRSKKTRALLAYLAATGKEHSRARLCSLLWETTDDPRGALRWSLSKLRPLVNDDAERLSAGRERILLRSTTARIDCRELEAAVEGGVASVETRELERIAGLVRGEFLEGFELPDLFEFQAWSVAQREQARERRCGVLGELVRRLAEAPRRALPYARALVEADSVAVAARLTLLGLLLSAGKSDEARQQLEIALRLFRELDAPGLPELLSGWRALQAGQRSQEGTPAPESPPPVRSGAPAPGEAAAPVPATTSGPVVGRRKELARLRGALEESRLRKVLTVSLVTGEPGIGKSHLAAVLAGEAGRLGACVLQARSFEAESSSPFGPWADALRAGLSPGSTARDPESPPASREGFFQSVADTLAARAENAGVVLLVLDDVQWLDHDSAELLHFVVRMCRQRPVAIVLLARGGELEDNEAILRALRGIRRDGRVDRVDLLPLSREDILELVPDSRGPDVETIWRASAGNPLFALELARSESPGATATTSLALLVRERIARLPAPAAEVLRWGAVLGHAIDVSRLESLSSLEVNELIGALERLEHHALLRSEGSGGRYVFAHDLVREVVYGELSSPRRRLMHRQVARLLAPGLPDPAVAAEVARHAHLAGEGLLGVRACAEASLGALRAFANADAEALARRGLELVDVLEEPDRIPATLDLLHLLYSARTPDREQAAVRVRDLAERALDLGLTRPARLGFQMLSFLRWESSSMADAHANILQAERVSRFAEPEERASALAHAARCFVLLERNMEQAEAFLLEADQLTRRGARETSAVPFTAAMLSAHRGEMEEAVRAFREARWMGREQGDRLAEFRAVEHWTMLEVDRGRYDDAFTLAQELAVLGDRVREGAERPCGRALLALVRTLRGEAGPGTGEDPAPGEPSATSQLETAVEELRRADAKYELAFVLTRRARHEVDRGDFRAASAHAAEGLECAIAIGRATEIALSHALLARCAGEAGDLEAASRHREALGRLRPAALAAAVRDRLGPAAPGAGSPA